MAVQLYKLAISATVLTTVDTKPEVLKYFYILNPDDITGDVLTIPALRLLMRMEILLQPLPRLQPIMAIICCL
jgi:hypothetical protein